MKRIVLLVLSIVASLVYADHGVYVYDVVPGSEAIQTDRIREYHARWRQLARGEDGLVDSGTVFEERVRRTSDRILHTQIVQTARGIKVTEERTFDRRTLQPLSLSRELENGPDGSPRKIILEATDVAWRGTSEMEGGKPEAFEYVAATRAFDGWVAGLTLASLPLAVGYEARLPAMVQLQRATYWLRARVVERKEVRYGDSEPVPVWVVETDWVNVVDGSRSPGGAEESGGAYLIAMAPEGDQPHVIEYANNGAVIRWAP